MISKDYLLKLFWNEDSRKLFELKADVLGNITYNNLLKSSKLFYFGDNHKKEVLYVIFSEPQKEVVDDGYINRYLCKIITNENKFEWVNLHRYSTSITSNIESSPHSVPVDYIRSHDRCMSVFIQSYDYFQKPI